MTLMAEPILNCRSCWEKDCSVGIPEGILLLWWSGLRGCHKDVTTPWADMISLLQYNACICLLKHIHIHCLSGWITGVELQMENKHDTA